MSNDHWEGLMDLVIEMQKGISTDHDEWEKYAQICTASKGGNVQQYIDGCRGLWTDGLDQHSWSCVMTAASQVPAGSEVDFALAILATGYHLVHNPSHNADEWGQLQQYTLQFFNEETSTAKFVGVDTRGPRTLVNPDKLPLEADSSFLIRKHGFPAAYSLGAIKITHVEYFMRLEQTDVNNNAYILLTHSGYNGGYVGLARIEGKNITDGRVTVHEDQYAGDIIWWHALKTGGLFGHSDPAACNHPGNGGQIGSKVILVGQDWYPSAVSPADNGNSKVLFYDFSSLQNGVQPSDPTSTDPGFFKGFIKATDFGIRTDDSGNFKSVVLEQGPDGRYLLIMSSDEHTVCWVSSTLVPDISTWQQIVVGSNMSDGSGMLAWATFGANPLTLFYVTASKNGFDFKSLKYLISDEKVIGVALGDKTYRTQQSDAFGSDEPGTFGSYNDWVADNGSLSANPNGKVAIFGSYKSTDDEKGAEDTPCIQVRAWYT